MGGKEPTYMQPQAVGHGKTLKSKAGTAATSGNNTLVAAVAGMKIRVFAFSITTASTTALTCIFQDGASGTALWQLLLQAATDTTTGANLTASPSGYLFETSAATLLNLNLSAAQTVHYSVAYFEEPA